jgi:ppGpp synthetase/RelA/SpoT-type nucleotidyltranferase
MVRMSVTTDTLSRLWDERPEVIRAFVDERSNYEQLGAEVAYILEKRLRAADVEFAAITHRAKTVKSFAEKVWRKRYKDPMTEMSDLAGVRVVYLYRSSRKAIEEVIEVECDIVEKVDKVAEDEPTRFGYGALHYLVRVGRKSSGARYDDLKALICEVQVRTVLQDAWAIIDHHLNYKKESDVPRLLRRKLNALAGLFETADDQFDRIRAEREDYLASMAALLSKPEAFLEQELNLDTFEVYLSWKFPERKRARNDKHVSRILGVARKLGVTTLRELDRVVAATARACAASAKEAGTPAVTGEIAVALAFYFPEFRKTGTWHPIHDPLWAKFEHLIERDGGASAV